MNFNLKFNDLINKDFFVPYNSISSFDIVDKRLQVVFNSSGGGQGALKLNRVFSSQNTQLTFELTNIEDSATRFEHGGCWISNEEGTDWTRLSFHNDSVGIVKIPLNNNPKNIGNWVGVPDASKNNPIKKLSLNEKIVFKLIFHNNFITFYVDNFFVGKVEYLYDTFFFYIFGYRLTLDFDNFEFINLNTVKTIYPYWRISNIEKRLNTDPYRSVGNIVFHTKDGLVSNDPSKTISESSFSEETDASKAFDGLDNTYSLSGNLPDGTSTIEHGEDWWIGYNFEKSVEINSIDISMRYDMEGEVDNITDNSLGQEWTSFQVDGSDNGIDWDFVYTCPEPKIFKNDNSLHSYKLNIEDSSKSDRWRVTNITNLQSSPNDTHYYITVEELSLNSDDSINVIKVSSNSNSPHRVENILLKNSRSLYENDWQNRSILPYIEFQFEAEVEIQSVDLKMRYDMNPAWYQEWQTADLFYFKNDRWILYGNITPKISHMNLAPIEGVPVNKFSDSKLVYQKPTNTDNKYKFWRCSNIKTEPSEEIAILNNSIAKLDFKNTENLKISSIYNTFSSSNERLGSSGYLRTSEFAFDENPETHAHSRTATDSAENYTIGCMFDTPVEVTSLGIQARHDLRTVWGENWQYCTVDKSENGFDWYPTAYCIFNTPKAYTGYLESPLYSLDTLGPKYKFWRVINPFYRNLKNTLEFSLWELRFNTLTGEISNNPSKAFSNSSWSTSYLPKNAFDTNTSTGVYPEKDFQEPYYIGYEFNTPQYVNSLYILLRRDNALLNEYLLFIEVQASEDGVTWVSQGYSNLGTLSDSLFCLSYIESYNLIDKLSFSSLDSFNSVSFKEALLTFSSKYLDPEITNLNIYNPNSNGVVKGQVLELNVPVIREVAIYDRRTRQLIAITWSNEEGFYEFKNLNSNKTYYVHAIDSNKIYNAVTKDMLEPLK